jgi:2-polyprenyl-3-methyl-5-hydroxy-6-metoxy-1,4-benzoquinol methylase
MPMIEEIIMSDWRQRFYAKYLSSGQGHHANHYYTRAPYIINLIAHHVPVDRNTCILDLGCGAGDFIYWLKQRGYQNVVGVDVSAEMVAAAHNACLGEVKLGELLVELKAARSRSLDVVLAIDVLEHMNREELLEICDEIFRVLKPGGRIVAHVPNAAGIFGSAIRYGDLTHELAFTASSIRQLFKTAGFRDVRCYEDKPIPRGVKSFGRAVFWSIGTIGFRLLYAAETGTFDCILSRNLLATALVAEQ